MTNGLGWISLNTVEAAEQLPSIVEVTRAVLCRTAFPWHVHVAIDLRAPDEEESVEEMNPEDRDEQAIQQEIDDYKDHQKRRREEEAYWEREHRMRLLSQAGKPVEPEDFAAPEETKSFSVSNGDSEKELETAERPEAGSGQLWMQGVITEEGFFADIRGRAAAEHLMGRAAEDAAA
jgi:hypothetical protein